MALDAKIDLEAHSDLGNLTSDLLQEAYGEIVRLKTEPFRGRELGNHPEVGDLSDCRKQYFNHAKHRIVYQLRPNEQKPRLVYIVAVGRRANLAVYHAAALRLGRKPGIDAPAK